MRVTKLVSKNWKGIAFGLIVTIGLIALEAVAFADGSYCC